MSTKKSPKLAICRNSNCQKEFEVKPATRGWYCSRTCSDSCIKRQRLQKFKRRKAIETRKQDFILKDQRCLTCDIILEYRSGNKKFCSNSCSAKFNNSQRPTKYPIRYTEQKYQQKHHPKIIRTKYPFTRLYGYKCCSACGKEYWELDARKKPNKTCSPECARLNSTYRKIVHEYEHNGKILKLESSWEVEIAQWLDLNHINWERPNHLPWFDGIKNRKYFPDFYLPDFDIYLDPKNDYQISKDKEKLLYFKNKIVLYYGTVDYIINNVKLING